MFPFNFEWNWDASHVIFMGGLWYALLIIVAGVTWVVVKSARESMKDDDEDWGGD